MKASIHTKLQLLLIIPLILFCVGAEDAGGGCSAPLVGGGSGESDAEGSATAKTDCEYVYEALATALEDYASDIEAENLDCDDISLETLEEDVISGVDDILADESAKADSSDSESSDDGATRVAACKEFAEALATLEEEEEEESDKEKSAASDDDENASEDEDATDTEDEDASTDDLDVITAMLEEFGESYCEKDGEESDDEEGKCQDSGTGQETCENENDEGEGHGDGTCFDPDTLEEIECAGDGEGEGQNMEEPSAKFAICQMIKDLSLERTPDEDNSAAAEGACEDSSTELGDDKEILCDSFERARNGDTTAYAAVEEICGEIAIDWEEPEETGS
jgi:hypothetical protein